MYSKTVFVTCLLPFIFVHSADVKFGDATWPYDLKTQFSFPTYAPARIDTFSAKLVNSSTPLKVTIPIHDRLLVTNTGTLVNATTLEPTNRFTLSGGIFADEIYTFSHVFFSWNNDHLENTGASVDGVGTALQAVAVFYNGQYGSPANARNYRNGFVLFVVKLEVQGTAPNPDFTKFEQILRTLTVTGSSCVTTAEIVTSYFGLPPVPTYYAYPGSFYPVPADEQPYFCATIIELPKSNYQSISIAQFSAFTNLKNKYDSLINARVASFTMGPRPVVQGINLIHVPI